MIGSNDSRGAMALLRGMLVSLGIVALVSGCVSRRVYDETTRELGQHKKVLADLRGHQRALDDENKMLRERLTRMAAASEGQDAILREAALQKQGFEEERDKLRAALEALRNGEPGGASVGDFEIISVPGGGTALRIGGRLLFALGEVKLSSEGESLLHSIADELRGQSNIGLKVVGHTDNTPFAKESTKRAFPFGNLQLSAIRAIVVAAYLEKQCGLPGGRIWVEGRGPYQPIVPNDSVENKSRNRRVEIHFMELDTSR